jgi:hypothetical protein
MKIKKFTEKISLAQVKHLLMIVSIVFAVASVVSVGLSVLADAYDTSSESDIVTEDNADEDSAELMSEDEYDQRLCDTTQNNLGYVKSMTMKTVNVTVKKGKKKTIDGPVIDIAKSSANTHWSTGRGDAEGYRILDNYEDSIISLKAVDSKGKTNSISYSYGYNPVVFTNNERIQIEGIERGTTYFYVASVGWAEAEGKKGTGIVVDKNGYIKNAVIKVKVTVIDPYAEAVVPNTKVTICKGASKTNRIGIHTQDMKSGTVEVTAKSNKKSVATVTYSSKSASKKYLTITGKRKGKATITVKVTGTGKDGKKYSNTQTIKVTVLNEANKTKQVACNHTYVKQYKLMHHKAEKTVVNYDTEVYKCQMCSTCYWSGNYLGQCSDTTLSIHQSVVGHHSGQSGFAYGPVNGTRYDTRAYCERIWSSSVCTKCGKTTTSKSVSASKQNSSKGY